MPDEPLPTEDDDTPVVSDETLVEAVEEDEQRDIDQGEEKDRK